jgi:hypothetical protein
MEKQQLETDLYVFSRIYGRTNPTQWCDVN